MANAPRQELTWPSEYVRPRDAVRIIERMALADIPAILVGPPGIGKSAIAKDLVARVRRPDGRPRFRAALVINISYRKPTFVGDQPIIADREIRVDGEVVACQVAKYVPPDLLPLGDEEADTLIIWDDVSSAPPSVQAAFLEVLHEKKVGSYDLPRGAYQVGTANRAGDHIAAFELSAAVISRGAMIGMRPDVEDLRQHALRSEWDARIPAFLAFRPNLAFSFDARTDAGRNFATGRTWEHVDRTIRAGWDPAADPLSLSIGAALVGPGPAAEFVAFSRTYGALPDPEEVFQGRNPKAPKYPAAAWAWAVALAAAAMKRSDPVAAGARLAEYGLDHLPGEHATLALRDLLSSTPFASRAAQEQLAGTPQFGAFYRRYGAAVMQ